MHRSQLLLTFAILMYCATASAQSLDGRFHLALGTQLARIGYESIESTPVAGIVGGPDQRFVAELGQGWISTTVGYAFADRWVIDLQASVAHVPEGVATTDAQTTFTLGPALRYVFARGATTRPYLTIGAEGGAQVGGDFGYWSVGGALGAGLQIWLIDRLSIDPQLSLAYAHRRQKIDYQDPQAEWVANSVSLDAHFMLSVWL